MNVMTSNPNRWVAALTPVVFAPLAGAISVLAAKYVPGVDIDSGSVEAIFIAGATIAFAKAGLWLKGWQDYEKRQVAAAPEAADPVAGFDAGGELDLDPDDLDSDLDSDLDGSDLLDPHDELDLDEDPDDGLVDDGEPLVPAHKE